MNNMLYIVVGLVIVIVIAVVLMRKNKSQAPAAGVNRRAAPPTTTKPLATGETKFDDLTVAQRFIDQQRYDRAIETLDRGLKTTPNDHKLWLKLLNVYALTKQTEDFYRTYETINQQADPVTLAEAQKLKSLFDAEQGQNAPISSSPISHNLTDSSQPVSQETLAPATTPTNSSADDLAFDLDLAGDDSFSLPKSSDEKLISENKQPLASPQEEKSVKQDAFDLTLEDLEASDLDLESFGAAESNPDLEDQAHKAPKLDDELVFDDLAFDDLALDDQDADERLTLTDVSPTAPTTMDLTLDEVDQKSDQPSVALAEEKTQDNVTSPVNEDDDFDFDLALNLDNDDTQPDPASFVKVDTDQGTSKAADDFVLDLEDLDSDELDAELDNLLNESLEGLDELEILENPTHETSDDNPVNTALKASEQDDDFAMFGLEDASFEPSTDLNDVTHPVVSSDLDLNPDLDTDLELNLDFETDTSITNTSIKDSAHDQSGAINEVTETKPLAAEPLFDDELGLESEDQNALDVKVKDVQPVAITAELSTPFSSDFDELKSIDNLQITLDLAEQYLELGEYDSAKRLLNEVMSEGNSQQQQFAKSLLAKTA